MTDELTWIIQAQHGDDDAFTNLVDTYQKPVYNLCYRMLGELEAAEDAAQETFLKAFRFHDHFQPGTNLRAWLFKILHNTFINRYRRRLREQRVLDEIGYPDGLRVLATIDRPLEAFGAKDGSLGILLGR